MVVEAGGEGGVVRVEIRPHVVVLVDFESITRLNLKHRSGEAFSIGVPVGRPLVGKAVHSSIRTVAGDITAARSAVGIHKTILDRVAVCARRIHLHRGFKNTIRTLDDIHRLQIGLRVGIICREDHVGGLSPNHPVRCGASHRSEDCARDELFHMF